MSAMRSANPYDALKFDFDAYEAEVEKGRKWLVIAMIVSLAIAVVNIAASLVTYDSQVAMIQQGAQLVVAEVAKTNPMAARDPQLQQALDLMQKTITSPEAKMQSLLSSVIYYILVTAIPWALVYVGVKAFKGLVGMLTGLAGIVGLIGGVALVLFPPTMWFGIFSIVMSVPKFFAAGILLSNKSVQKHLNHMS